MDFKLELTAEAEIQLAELEKYSHFKRQFKAVCKALNLLSKNPRHPGLNTHKYGEIFEAYAQNNTPGAYRIFFYYGPQVTIR